MCFFFWICFVLLFEIDCVPLFCCICFFFFFFNHTNRRLFVAPYLYKKIHCLFLILILVCFALIFCFLYDLKNRNIFIDHHTNFLDLFYLFIIHVFFFKLNLYHWYFRLRLFICCVYCIFFDSLSCINIIHSLFISLNFISFHFLKSFASPLH